MQMQKNQNHKKCWGCGKIIVGDSKFGLCPECVNKFGTPAAAALSVGGAFLVKKAIDNKEKIVKGGKAVLDAVSHMTKL